ncbi:MAG: HAD family hydrolase [Chloroflexota bacterium]|nr:HAD family hydrolase [Chloroflexota bacterium]
MPAIRSVIFDCYSTLIDIRTDEGKKEVFERLSLYLRYYGASVSAAELKASLEREKKRHLKSTVERYPEVDLEAVFRRVLERARLGNPFLAESCCKLFRLLSRERFELFPDTLPVLQQMKRAGYGLAVVSDAQKTFCIPEGEMLGLNQFFDHIVLSTQYGFRKPDPRLFTIACSLLGVSTAEAVYVGNDPDKDVEGAKGAGMRVVLVNRGEKAVDGRVKPDFHARDLQQAWRWIEGNS